MEFHGSPYEILQPLEETFGAVFGYRLPGPAGRSQLLLATLHEVRTVTEDGPLQPAGLRAALDEEGRRPPTGDEPFIGDLVFAFAHDMQWALRPPELPAAPAPARPGGPLGVLARISTALLYDEENRSIEAFGPQAGEALDVARRCPAGAGPEPDRCERLTEVISGVDTERYRRQVDLAKRYFDKGDVYQAVISVPVRVRPHAPVHRYFGTVAHRYDSAAYSYWLSVDGIRIFGNCSLPHVVLDGGQVISRVFAGTAPADDGSGDQVRRLRTDSRYYSEHVMLVDLERNDIGALARPGTVRTERFLEPLVIGPTTYLASDVMGELPADTGLGDVLLTTFPRGVVVGAPKLRAQEVVAEIEEEPRGFYSGAIGLYRAHNGNVVSNTIVTCGQIEDDTVVLRCGGGVTNSSDSAQELSELSLKLAYLI